MKEKEIRALFDDETIVVYQAYRKAIALPALENQRFVQPFKMDRMTWIKPSFLWMMYRSGWAGKEGQEHVLAIRICRSGWEWALENSCLSHFVPGVHKAREDWREQLNVSPVRIQWDPEKNISLENLDYRSIQVGLSGVAVEKYVNEWIVSIEDVSGKAREIDAYVKVQRIDEATGMLPEERIYPLSERLRAVIGAS